MTVARQLHLAASIVGRAAAGMRHGAGVQTLSVGIMALCLTALGAFGEVLLNVSRLADSWNQDLLVVAFLKHPVAAPALSGLLTQAAQLPGVVSVTHVGTAQARERLQGALGARAVMLAGLSDAVIPQAVEVELDAASSAPGAALVAAALSQDPAVSEVAYGAEELSRLGAVVGILKIAGGLLGALIALVTVLVISNTLKLAVLARREEIEIMKLVGAGDAFVRAPFLLEGAAQGVLGGLLAGGCLLALHATVALRVEDILSQAFGPVSLGGPPWEMVGALMALGLSLGVMGGLVGVGRFLRV